MSGGWVGRCPQALLVQTGFVGHYPEPFQSQHQQARSLSNRIQAIPFILIFLAP